MSESNESLVTFITVVFNGVTELELTINSILAQTEKRFEYYIIDGGSTDGTLALIEKYKPQITGFISEKDHGLYDAMNKGMKLGIGKYFWFMNAGDQLFSNDVLEKIFSSLNVTHDERSGNVPRPSSLAPLYPDVIYGETEVLDQHGNHLGDRRLKAPKKLKWRSLQWGMVVCHQSFLVKREKCLPYNLKYTFASDIDWMIRILMRSKTIHNTHLILSKFKSGGVSQKNIRHSLKERFGIMVHYYGFLHTIHNHVILGTKFFFYYLRHRRI